MKKVLLQTKYVNKLNHPLEDAGVTVYQLAMPVDMMPEDIPLGANPRAQNVNKGIYKTMIESLAESKKKHFFLRHKGIDIVASQARETKAGLELVFNNTEFEGAINGGHTIAAILANKDKVQGTNQYVPIRVVTGIKKADDILSISAGGNTGVSVQTYSLANHAGEFDDIKAILARTPLAGRVSYKENEPGEVNIRDLIQVVMMFAPGVGYEEGQVSPQRYYNSAGAAMKDFLANRKEIVNSLEGVLTDILNLKDYISDRAASLYNEAKGGKAGSLMLFRSTRPEYLPYLETTTNNPLAKGALFPILAAFGTLMGTSSSGRRYWKVGLHEVELACVRTLASMVHESNRTLTRDCGNSIDRLGKSTSHWNCMAAIVERTLSRK